MSREIKFKFWLENREESFMVTPSYYLAGVDVYGKPWFDKINTNTHKYTDDQYEIIPLQYTGLKDKDKTDIYEGDIVTWRVNESEFTHEIGFEAGHFQFINSNGDWFDPLRGELEVIGNIYENPELLK